MKRPVALFAEILSSGCILAVESFANHKTIYNFAPQLFKRNKKTNF